MIGPEGGLHLWEDCEDVWLEIMTTLYFMERNTADHSQAIFVFILPMFTRRVILAKSSANWGYFATCSRRVLVASGEERRVCK